MVGTKRVGAVVARRLAQAGVRLALSYRGSKRAAQQLQAELAPITRTCLVQADVSRPEDVVRLIRTVREQLGDLSFLVNLASGFPRAPLESLDAAAWEAAEPAARANYLLAVHASRSMRRNSGPTRGHLIFFSDWAAGGTPYRNYLPYLTSKASIDFMTRAFAVELAPHGILVNAIAPGSHHASTGNQQRGLGEIRDRPDAPPPRVRCRRDRRDDRHPPQERDHHGRDHPGRCRPPPGGSGRGLSAPAPRPERSRNLQVQ